MGTCNHPVNKNLSMDDLNKNTTNAQDPRKVGLHPKKMTIIIIVITPLTIMSEMVEER